MAFAARVGESTGYCLRLRSSQELRKAMARFSLVFQDNNRTAHAWYMVAREGDVLVVAEDILRKKQFSCWAEE